MAHLEQAGQDSELRTLLAKIKEARQGITSICETVQSILLGPETGFFTTIESSPTVFKWQGERQFLADVSDAMRGACSAFYVGSDGDTCWWYHESERETKLVTCPFEEVHEKNVLICDPLELMERDVESAIQQLRLEYVGPATIEQRECHVLQSWSANIVVDSILECKRIRWWIGAETYRPLQAEAHYGPFRVLYRFVYDRINEAIPESEFAPVSVKGVTPQEPEPLNASYDTRFLRVVDGSNGRMSCRWGRHGPKGEYSSGLN